MEEISVKPRMAQFLPRSQCVFMLFRPVAQHWKRWATPPLALWKLSCRSTPISPLSAEQAAIRLVFPAQSGSKLWPSLCAFRNPAHCHSDSLPCFSNSISPRALSHLVLVPQHHSDPLSTHRTSCSRYSDIWERSSDLKHLNYCTADPAQQENASAGANRPAEAPRQDLLDVTVGGEDICTFLVACGHQSRQRGVSPAVSWSVSFHIGRAAGFRPLSQAWLEGCGGDASSRHITGRVTSGLWFISLTQKLVRGVFSEVRSSGPCLLLSEM